MSVYELIDELMLLPFIGKCVINMSFLIVNNKKEEPLFSLIHHRDNDYWVEESFPKLQPDEQREVFRLINKFNDQPANKRMELAAEQKERLYEFHHSNK